MRYILVKRLLLSPCIWVLLSLTAYSQANYYTLPGLFLYAINSTSQVVDTAYDGSIAVALANDPDQVHPALLTTFDPNTGMKFDSKIFGFGPAHVQVANSALGSRVVVLSNEGGPNTVTIFDLSQTGILTRRASNRLQNNDIDYRSNLALSSAGGVGFVIVIGDSFDTELVAFRLDDGAVLSRFPLRGAAFETLRLKEVNGKRLVSFIRFVSAGRSLVVIDETNPAQPLEISSVPLEIIPNPVGIGTTGMEFSSDGRFVFLANQLNTTTGEYQFTNCSGLSISGTGTITRRGGFITLQQASGDRRVMAKIDTSINKATATIQLLSQGLTLSITDRNISNNTCACH